MENRFHDSLDGLPPPPDFSEDVFTGFDDIIGDQSDIPLPDIPHPDIPLPDFPPPDFPAPDFPPPDFPLPDLPPPDLPPPQNLPEDELPPIASSQDLFPPDGPPQDLPPPSTPPSLPHLNAPDIAGIGVLSDFDPKGTADVVPSQSADFDALFETADAFLSLPGNTVPPTGPAALAARGHSIDNTLEKIDEESELTSAVWPKARAIYDFEGDTSNGELNLYAGESISVLRQDIGDGWWEARNSRGEQGLIPETYVEVVSIPEPQFPPPPPPIPSTVPSARPTSIPTSNGWGSSGQNGPNSGWGGGGSGGGPGVVQQQSYDDDWDDDFEDDDDDDQSSNSTTSVPQQDLQGSGSYGLSLPKRESKAHSPTAEMSKYGTVKSSFNRWSHFAKSGGEAFMMGQTSPNLRVSEDLLIRMIETEDGPEWTPVHNPYTCVVASPKKESKLKGLKSYIAYQLTPSINGIQVSRRYKHFDWLHERLEEKYPCIPIPPLPDKAISGRYEDDFVNDRLRKLQLWVDRMSRHPIISKSEVFIHFLTTTDEKKWKQGKRRAEKDEYSGGKFFLLLQTPPHLLDLREVEPKMETFCKFVNSMTESCKTLMNTLHENAKKQTGGFRGQYHKIGSGFKQLAVSFNMDQGTYSQALTAAMDYTGDTYKEIGDLYWEQPNHDTWPLHDYIGEYKGILHVYPDVLKVHEGAIGKAKECQKLQEEGKMQEKEVQDVVQKADIISYGTLAEMNHFQKERVVDFKMMTKEYLEKQIEFFKKITQKLEDTLHRFDDA